MISSLARAASVGVFLVACLGARTELEVPKCGQPGGTCTTVVKTASKVNYHCNTHIHLYFLDETHDGIIPVCLPPELNRYTGSPQQVAALDAMSQHDYDVAVAGFGDTLLHQLAALKAIDATGANCFVWEAALRDPETACTVIEATRDPFCEDGASCAEADCVPNDCHDPELPDGGINPHTCACNTSISNVNDCFFPGATVCIAPE